MRASLLLLAGLLVAPALALAQGSGAQGSGAQGSGAQGSGGQDAGLARPNMLLRETVTGMPRGERQDIQVLTASFRPGDRTVFHTHRHPVTVYVLEGTFTLELEGRAPLVVRAGEAMVEPPGVKMTGYNRSADAPLRVVIVYVGEPGAPFLDLH